MFHRRISLNPLLLLLLVNFVSGFRLELLDISIISIYIYIYIYDGYIYPSKVHTDISIIISSRSNLTRLHGFQQLVLLPELI